MTKGYKATEDYSCRDQLYEIGQEYKMDEKPILCKKGFHYCRIAKNVLKYYGFKPCFKLLEIEDLSEDTVHKNDKSCSNHIKIIREITDPDELLNLLGAYQSFDKQGNLLTYKNSDGYWEENTYNLNGDKLTHKTSDEFVQEWTYNSIGDLLTRKNSRGYWEKLTYDSDGRKLTYENSNGYWTKQTYDLSGNTLTFKCSNGYSEEHMYTLDADGNQIKWTRTE